MNTPLAERLQALAARVAPADVPLWLDLCKLAHDVRRMERALDELVADAAEQARAIAAEERVAAVCAAASNVVAFPRRPSGGRVA